MPKPASLSVGLRLLLASQAMAPLSVKLGLVQQLGAEKAALLAPHMSHMSQVPPVPPVPPTAAKPDPQAVAATEAVQ